MKTKGKNENTKARRNEIECELIEIYSEASEPAIGKCSYGAAKVMLFRAFFEIYDQMEKVSHTPIVDALYFDRDSADVNLQKVANDCHTDMSTLWRYRQKYTDVFGFLTNAPAGSFVAMLLERLT